MPYHTMDPTSGEFQWSFSQFIGLMQLVFPIKYHHVIKFSPDGWMNLQCQQQMKTWLISHVS